MPSNYDGGGYANGGYANGYASGYAKFPATMFPDPADCSGWSTWSRSDVRRLRYRILYDFYSSAIYLGHHGEFIRRQLGLYKNVRAGMSPIRQVVEFGVAHIHGGPLDAEAGPGGTVPSALPIIPGKKASSDLPAAIATLWRSSRWSGKRELFTRNGLLTGDTGIEIQVDSNRGEVKMVPLNPNDITDCWHVDGVIQSITREYEVIDPLDRTGQKTCQGKEIITLDDSGKFITYETFRNDVSFPWPGNPDSAWDYPIPFIPIVLAQNIDMSQPWGVSEVAPALQTVTELDNQISNLADAKLKENNGPWLLSGAEFDGSGMNPYPDHDTLDDITMGGQLDAMRSTYGLPPAPAQPGFRRENMRLGEKSDVSFLTTSNAAANAKPLIYPINVADAMGLINRYDQSLRESYPELQIKSNATASGDASGRALRIYRSEATQKIQQRRSAYDECLVAAHRMAIAVGGGRGFPGYESFGVQSFNDSSTDHRIGAREVFPSDPLDVTEIKAAQWDVVTKAVVAGVPLPQAMKLAGMPEADVDDTASMIQAERDEKEEQEQERVIELVTKSLAADADAANADAAKDTANPKSDPDGMNKNGSEAAGTGGA